MSRLDGQPTPHSRAGLVGTGIYRSVAFQIQWAVMPLLV
jgi:hypothetical protein